MWVMHCLTCHYNLRNLVEHRCPECGRVFDPNNSRSFFPNIAMGKRSKTALGIIVTILVATILLGVLEAFYRWIYSGP